MNQCIYKSATELAKLIRKGKATSSDIVKEHLEQIKDHNEKLNVLISILLALYIWQKCIKRIAR